MSSAAPMQQAKTNVRPTTEQRASHLATQHQQSSADAVHSDFTDLRAQTTAQRQLQDVADNSPQSRQLHSFQQMAQNSTLSMQLKAMSAMMNAPTVQRVEEEETLQPKTKGETVQREAATNATEAPKPNNTGLPDHLKSGIESLSGMSMDHVKVHYNSSQPAQLNAHAYAQGSEIHVAPGQEQHLPHEAWHVVQQAQGRVQPTMQMKGNVAVNDDAGLEAEADVMGSKALGVGALQMHRSGHVGVLELTASTTASPTIQRRWINNGKILMWESLIEGAQWFYEPDSKLMFYYRNGETSEKKSREVWVKEYGSDPLALEDPSVTAGMTGDQVRPEQVGTAGTLMEHFNARYFTKVYWDSKSGQDEEKDKLVIIETYVRKDDGGLESVYKNEMNIRTDAFYAANNQRDTDTKVGTTKSKAMFNSDLLTCHRHIAIEFARSQGIEMAGDGSSFIIVRKNVNNGAWQEISMGLLPVKIRIKLNDMLVTKDNPIEIGKPITYKEIQATTMWDIFKTMVPNTKAVYQMIKDRYPGYSVASWQYSGNGSLIARIVRN